ncbi:hypothetical protein HAX54_043627, partial [Datura stramonium]|nr:hypothetical protein [Datura stramonium]
DIIRVEAIRQAEEAQLVEVTRMAEPAELIAALTAKNRPNPLFHTERQDYNILQLAGEELHEALLSFKKLKQCTNYKLLEE